MHREYPSTLYLISLDKNQDEILTLALMIRSSVVWSIPNTQIRFFSPNLLNTKHISLRPSVFSHFFLRSPFNSNNPKNWFPWSVVCYSIIINISISPTSILSDPLTLSNSNWFTRPFSLVLSRKRLSHCITSIPWLRDVCLIKPRPLSSSFN